MIGRTRGTEMGFTGQARDEETGLDYFGARYLSTSRFLTNEVETG